MTAAAPRTSAPARPRPLAVLGAIMAFALIGAQLALYGPAIPALREAHGLSAAAAGAALSVNFAGAVLGVFALPLGRRLGLPDGPVLSGSLALFAAGCVVFILASTWPLALVGAFVVGVGGGVIDGGVNQVFTEVYTEGGHGMLNLLHGCFGAGAIAGPVAVGLLPGYAWAFAGCALLAVVALPMLSGLAGAWPAPGTGRPVRRIAVGVVGLAFLAFFVLQVGLETGAAGWETTHLIATGLPESTAASATSGFWLAFTAVRFAVVPLCRRYSAYAIVAVCTALTVVAATATLLDPLAPAAYVLLGVAVGPLFPTGLAWLAQVRPNLTSTVVAVSMLGGIAFPPAIGLAVEASGSAAIPKSLVVLAALGFATLLVMARERGHR